MPEKDIIRVPYEEIRRTIESLDGRRALNRARPPQRAPRTPQRAPRRAIPRSLIFEEAMQLRKEPIRVSPEEMRRTLEDINRRRAEERAPRRQDPVSVPPDEMHRTLQDIDRRHAHERALREQKTSRAPPEEIYRTLEDMDH
ncbi:hypothetical protein B0J13DRAFT_613346 [Dactylonectria estremocensis]|uniref:Uncharacterized protein n=1 Tax=Dactylonectria estremocensis TaxID=1079267 RepID=A0A9P9DC60_9HYPO|nr:hypothetical protein B0J13DRAFT_613346 [Dactylonectria estremocensis]